MAGHRRVACMVLFGPDALGTRHLVSQSGVGGGALGHSHMGLRRTLEGPQTFGRAMNGSFYLDRTFDNKVLGVETHCTGTSRSRCRQRDHCTHH